MNRKLQTALAAATLCLLAACSDNSNKSAPAPAAPAPAPAQPAAEAPKAAELAAATPSVEQIRAMAKDAYIFTYPLVMNYRTMYAQAIKGDAAFGKWVHLGLAKPSDHDIVTPNNDTPYSYAWVDVRAEPWVLTLPKIEKTRFYTSQWDDLWGYVLDNPGSVADGNDGGSYLLAAPSWTGETPKGIKRVVRGDSDILGTLTRTQVIGGPSDLPKVRRIQQGYQLVPLSKFLGAAAPAPAPAIEWPAWNEGDEMKPAYWSYVALMLPRVTRREADKAEFDKLAALGLTAGEPWKADALPAATRDAMQQGLEDAQAEMKKRSEGGVDAAKFFGPRDRVGTDYISRAMGVYMGIFGNVPEVSVYLSMPADADGKPLDGSKASYALTFPKGQLPPVKYFWSVTMYTLPDRFLAENPINRYSIGSSSPGLKTNADGSLTLYVSAKSPGKARESNWLPAPNGPFWTVLRTYGPSKEVIDGSYKQPDYVPTALKP